MSFTTTTNYGLQKPDFNTEIDLWWDFLNDNFDKISTQMKVNADAAAAAAAAVAGKAPLAHSHVITDTTGLQAALDGKAPTSHTHTTAQVTGLDAALAGKSPTGHTHVVADVTGLSDIATKEVQRAYTGSLTLADAGCMVTFAGAAAVAVPTTIFSAGHRIDFINLSSGVVSFSGGTLRSFPATANKLAGQYAGATIWFLSASEYILVGNIIV